MTQKPGAKDGLEVAMGTGKEAAHPRPQTCPGLRAPWGLRMGQEGGWRRKLQRDLCA